MGKPMSNKFENAMLDIISTKKGWCREAIMLLKCDPYPDHYIVNAYITSFDRNETSENFTILLTEVIMHLN